MLASPSVALFGLSSQESTMPALYSITQNDITYVGERGANAKPSVR
jgi:hypothetical protein